MNSTNGRQRRWLISLAKLLLGLGIIAWLLWQAQQNDRFEQLAQGEKSWGVLFVAFGLTGFNALLTFVRWHFVARAAGVTLSLGEAIRLGALGFTLNFVGPGAIGGDVFKAAVLAKDRAGQRTAAVTTVVVDRALAMVSLLIFASAGFLSMLWSGALIPNEIRIAGWFAIGMSIGVPVFFACVMWLSRAYPALVQRLQYVPFIGPIISQMLFSWGEYRNGLKWLGVALLICFCGHTGLIGSFHLIGVALPFDSPGFREHAFMVPFACLSGGVLPLPSGLGAVEGTLEYFYRWFGAPKDVGLLVALGYRLTMIAVACITAPYYFAHHAIVKKALKDAEAGREDSLSDAP